MFKIGQRVVCVDASFNAETRPYMPCWVTKGETYTIRGIHTDHRIPGYGVYLEEVINPEQVWSDDEPREWPFAATRFRHASLLRPAVRISATA